MQKRRFTVRRNHELTLQNFFWIRQDIAVEIFQWFNFRSEIKIICTASQDQEMVKTANLAKYERSS